MSAEMERSEDELSDRLMDERDMLRQEVARLEKRDLKATIELCYNDGRNPFAREKLRVVDVGVADNAYVVESEVVDLLRRQVEVLLRHIIAESPNAGVSHMGQPQCYGCLGVGDCKDESACKRRLRDWSLEQAKKGGGGECFRSAP